MEQHKMFGSVLAMPRLFGLTWHLPYTLGKITEKPQAG